MPRRGFGAELSEIKAGIVDWAHLSFMWQPIATAPFDRDLELAVMDASGEHVLVFPCRRVLDGWINAMTKQRVDVHPTHWREWKNEPWRLWR